MRTLVVIPSLMHKYTFSAPLAWLFGHDVESVRGVYSAQLDKKTVQAHDSFIVELNWFIELHEFGLITHFIKRHNMHAKILFGGLYSQIKFGEIFSKYPVDYFIKGDAEVPIREYLNGTPPEKIPNLVGRHFTNPQSYHFTPDEFDDLAFDLDWIPEYETGWESFPEPGNPEDMSFEQIPRFPQYWEKPNTQRPLSLRWRVPPRGGRYHLPMLFTGRGGCPAAHRGCEYCMGARHDVMRAIYGRPPVVMSNEHLIRLLHKIDRKFKRVTLYINSHGDYDLRGHHFDLNATIEIDCQSTANDAAKLMYAFREANLHIALFKEGITGEQPRSSVDDYLALEDPKHKMHFFATKEETKRLNIPPETRLYTEFVFPSWANWDYYTDTRNAEAKSRQWFMVTNQVNLYPLPRRLITKLTRPFVVNTLWALQKTGLVKIEKLIF